MIKGCPYFRVKWIGINKQGSTWEPKVHLIGEKAESILSAYLDKKEAEHQEAEKRKNDLLTGNLVETGTVPSVRNDDNNQSSLKQSKLDAIRSRVNESPWRHHFGKWFWDNSVSPATKRAVCLICQVRHSVIYCLRNFLAICCI